MSASLYDALGDLVREPNGPAPNLFRNSLPSDQTADVDLAVYFRPGRPPERSLGSRAVVSTVPGLTSENVLWNHLGIGFKCRAREGVPGEDAEAILGNVVRVLNQYHWKPVQIRQVELVSIDLGEAFYSGIDQLGRTEFGALGECFFGLLEADVSARSTVTTDGDLVTTDTEEVVA